jgi:hypothetical protein
LGGQLARGEVRVELGGAESFQNKISKKHVHVLCTVRGEIRKRQVNLYMEHVQNMFLAVTRCDQMDLSVKENIL